MGDCRIDFDEQGQADDVAIEGVSLFCLERMDKDSVWIAVYYEDGGRDTFRLSSKRKIHVKHDDERGT